MVRTAMVTLTIFLLSAPLAFAGDDGQGTYGPANDKVVTNAGFILIGFFPLFILVMSLIQWRLEKRKDERKAAAKARASAAEWKGGW
jgi:preprotein translocase subunit SecG